MSQQQAEHVHAVRMSNRQYGLLRYLNDARGAVGLDEISHLNQQTLGSFKRGKNWMSETASRDSIRITSEGRDALKAFEHGDFLRQVARMKFSSFLSLDVYEEGKKRIAKPAREAMTVRQSRQATGRQAAA